LAHFGAGSNWPGTDKIENDSPGAVMRIEFKRLNHVQLSIPPGQEGRAREFYGSVLGLEELEKPEALRGRGGLWFLIADIQLHIGVEEAARSTKRHPAFEVAGLESIREYLQANGTETRDEPSLPGVRRFSFFDPFGNRIELMEMDRP
jgi:catechol 2,3-dioxygenase-like lactoylglutathione lyase family enzyme